MKRSLISVAVLALTVVQGCSPVNSQMGNGPTPERVPTPRVAPPPPPPPAPPARCSAQGGTVELENKPKVDIVFVIDHSMSMEPQQKILTENISKFVDALQKNAALDYQIAIVNVADSRTYTDPNNPVYIARDNKEIRPEYRFGEFRHLKVCEKASCPIVTNVGRKEGYEKAGYKVLTDESRILSRETPNAASVLRDSLKLGTLAKDRRDLDPNAYGGAEFEEAFSSIYYAFYGELNRAGSNQGFPRANVPLFIFSLMDAGDSTPNISANALYQSLKNLKSGNDKMLGFAGVINNPYGKGKDCSADVSGTRGKIEEFHDLFLPNHRMMLNLCDRGWGTQLASVGDMIRERSSGKTIQLTCAPDLNSVRVTYGDQVIPRDDQNGWSYDPDQIAITISSKVNLTPIPGATFKIEGAAK